MLCFCCVVYQTEFYGELKQLTRKWRHWKIAWNNNLKCWQFDFIM